MKIIYNKSEKEILQGCIKGDRSSQEQLYHRYAKKMFSVCLGYASNVEDANDLLQEGFIKVFQNIHKCKGSGSLEGWIRKVIINNTIDHYRSSAGKNHFIEFTEIHLNTNSWLIGNEAYRTLDNEDFLMITRCLPDGYRLVMNLHFVEGYTHEEVAERLGISPGTSKSQLAKAKRYLRKTLDNFIDKELLETYQKYERRKLEKVV